jgi:hypothetical protein
MLANKSLMAPVDPAAAPSDHGFASSLPASAAFLVAPVGCKHRFPLRDSNVASGFYFNHFHRLEEKKGWVKCDPVVWQSCFS